MLSNTSVDIELIAYVRPDSLKHSNMYVISVFAPSSKTHVLLSTRLTSNITRDRFFTVDGEQDLFAQARTELRSVMGMLTDSVMFSTEHPNWD